MPQLCTFFSALTFCTAQLVEGGPEGWLFASLEIGDDWYCAPSSCEFTLFGLETAENGKDVKLHSFVTYNEAAQNMIKALHADHDTTDTVIKYSDMVLDPVKLVYVYGYNSTAKATVFYGQGGGDLPASAGGGKIIVQETVAPDYVAPLELFYAPSGTCETPYDTPVVYRRQK